MTDVNDLFVAEEQASAARRAAVLETFTKALECPGADGIKSVLVGAAVNTGVLDALAEKSRTELDETFKALRERPEIKSAGALGDVDKLKSAVLAKVRASTKAAASAAEEDEDEQDREAVNEAAETIRKLVIYGRRAERYWVRKSELDHFDISCNSSLDGALIALMSFAGGGLRKVHFQKAFARCTFPVFEEIDCDPSEGVTFEHEGKTVLNTYVPPTLKPKAGRWDRLRRVLETLTGNPWPDAETWWKGDDAGFRWLINWMAAKYQRPARRGMVAPVFIGPHGCGKTAMGQLFGRTLGDDNVTTIKGDALHEIFNSSYITKIFVVADELVVQFVERQEVSERIKPLITDSPVDLRMMRADRTKVPNHANYWITTNDAVPLKVEGEDERRYTIFKIDKSVMTEEYKRTIRGLFDQATQEPTAETLEELAAMAHDLVCWDVDWEMATRPLHNQARSDVIDAGQTGTERFLDEVARSDAPDDTVVTMILAYRRSRSAMDQFVLDQWSFEEGVTTEAVYKAYTHFCHTNGLKPQGAPKFGLAWKQQFKEKWTTVQRTAMPRVRVYRGLATADYLKSKNVETTEEGRETDEEQTPVH